MGLQYHIQPGSFSMIFVRFEQGRGKGGVPKAWLVPIGNADLATLVRQAVLTMRIACADPNAHGRDLMPGIDDEYELHNVDGGKIEEMSQITWETIEGQRRAELVLTWHNPADLLMMEPRKVGREDKC